MNALVQNKDGGFERISTVEGLKTNIMAGGSNAFEFYEGIPNRLYLDIDDAEDFDDVDFSKTAELLLDFIESVLNVKLKNRGFVITKNNKSESYHIIFDVVFELPIQKVLVAMFKHSVPYGDIIDVKSYDITSLRCVGSSKYYDKDADGVHETDADLSKTFITNVEGCEFISTTFDDVEIVRRTLLKSGVPKILFDKIKLEEDENSSDYDDFLIEDNPHYSAVYKKHLKAGLVYVDYDLLNEIVDSLTTPSDDPWVKCYITQFLKDPSHFMMLKGGNCDKTRYTEIVNSLFL